VVLDLPGRLADLVEVEARLSCRFLPLVGRLEPHARLLCAQQGHGLGDHVGAPQVDEARAAESGAQQAGTRSRMAGVNGSEVWR
jgi:hypothetical protein